MKIKSCGIIPFVKQNHKIKFLLVQHQAGHWSFPKGRIKKGEREIETAKRELVEETGLKDFEILKNICFTEKYGFEKDGKKYDKEVRYFLALVKSSKVKLSRSELQAYRWLGFKEAVKLITHESARDILRECVKIKQLN